MKPIPYLSLLTGVLLFGGVLGASQACAADVDVSALWSKNCASCHGKDGKGDTKAGKMKDVKDLTDPKIQADFSRDKMIQTVKEGIKDEKTGKERMKAFDGKLDDTQIGALVDWVIALKP
ncbi:MAG: cytochrome c [Candidatus Binatia bacterium]